MDRAAAVERRLALAEEHILRGIEHVARQREPVEHLEGRGQDSEQTRRVLRTFEASLSTHMADRDRLLRDIEYLFMLGPGTVSKAGEKK
jgi:hypothetical protein